ncbi:hypothetical protein Pfo_021858 [Paulownia fortunei]|nr:hypothetical protein Pfo_021858 [Paulownia fortunei]
MGTGWRRAFCNASATVMDKQQSPSPKLGRNKPSTTILSCKTNITDNNHGDNNINGNNLVSPKLQSKTTPKSQAKSPRTLSGSSTSSPRSPFSILKNTFCLSKNICGVCIQSVKRGQGTAISLRNNKTISFALFAAPLGKTSLYLQSTNKTKTKNQNKNKRKYYADDEPLVSPKAGTEFVPIPEAKFEDEEEVEEFQGFFVNPISSSDDAFAFNRDSRNVEVTAARRRATIDLVTVLDVGGTMSGANLEMLLRAMRLVISSLGSADRLSIVAFSANPERLLPLTRLTAQGQRSARRIIDRLACSQGTSMAEALTQATKLLEDRRERNPVASVIFQPEAWIILRFIDTFRPHGNTLHSSGFSHDSAQDSFSKCVGGLLSVVIQDLKIQLGFASGSDPAEISAVYSFHGRPTVLDLACISLGNLYAQEERELLVEVRVLASSVGLNHVFSIKSSYNDPATHALVYGRDHRLLLPRPQSVRPGLPEIERLRNAFITTRAIAESRRLIDHNEVSSAMQLLSSVRALLLQSRSESAGDCIRGLEVEPADLQWWRQCQRQRAMGLFLDENGEPLTPNSAWRAAEKLAKMAELKKSSNRASDLHGFENARF